MLKYGNNFLRNRQTYWLLFNFKQDRYWYAFLKKRKREKERKRLNAISQLLVSSARMRQPGRIQSS